MATDPSKSLIPSSNLSKTSMHELATKQLMAKLCLMYNRPLTAELLASYLSVLQKHLTPEQIMAVADKAIEQCEFMPSAAVLLRLAGIPNEAEKAKAEVEASDREGLELLADTLAVMRKHHMHSDSTQCRKFTDHLEAEKPDLLMAKVLKIFGGGDIRFALDILGRHPRFKISDEIRPEMGTDMNAITNLEKRWLRAWNEVKREQSK
jgi:uncharacterized protein YejL (UPF0352 family)